MRSLLLVAAVALAALVTTVPAAQAKRNCGNVSIYGTSTRIVVLQGTTCTQARRVARRFANSAGPFSGAGWRCALAHAPFDKLDGRKIGFSCGRGGSSGNIRTWPQAFVGTLA